ncbi:MAG: pentapeptide repeat-containing protein [Sandaracinaceae bacterium]|nr:pentapeptide repeat-containing protein [Sandaracinaceae bacterium]
MDLVLCESETERTITGGCGGGADLSNLDLSQGALAGGDFSDAVLDGANLTDADLTGANLEGTATGNLVGCSGATLHSDYECVARGDDPARFALIGPNLNLDGVDLSGVAIDGAFLNSSSFVGATLDNISLTNVNLQSANLTDASLTMAAIFGVEPERRAADGSRPHQCRAHRAPSRAVW